VGSIKCFSVDFLVQKNVPNRLIIICSFQIFSFLDQVDCVASLERCAQTTLILVQDLKSSTDVVAAMTASKVVPAVLPSDSFTNQNLPSLRTPLEDDMERAQFLMRLASRIRRLESDTVIALTYRMEEMLKTIQSVKDRLEGGENDDSSESSCKNDLLLLMIGHCMRGLALLGRGREVENIFARVAIMYVHFISIKKFT
jgi:conserved oligomeric Golgi complex subunit 2